MGIQEDLGAILRNKPNGNPNITKEELVQLIPGLEDSRRESALRRLLNYKNPDVVKALEVLYWRGLTSTQLSKYPRVLLDVLSGGDDIIKGRMIYLELRFGIKGETAWIASSDGDGKMRPDWYAYLLTLCQRVIKERADRLNFPERYGLVGFPRINDRKIGENPVLLARSSEFLSRTVSWLHNHGYTKNQLRPWMLGYDPKALEREPIASRLPKPRMEGVVSEERVPVVKARAIPAL